MENAPKLRSRFSVPSVACLSQQMTHSRGSALLGGPSLACWGFSVALNAGLVRGPQLNGWKYPD